MSLELPPNFESDIQGRDTALVPVIGIGTASESPDLTSYIFLSTNSASFSDHLGYETINTLPILLNVPSLKESIDIEKRNYKISSVNLDISNFPHDGKRFSEIIAEHNTISSSLINVECRIFWVSPSTKHFAAIDAGNPDLDSYPEGYPWHFEIYYGTIRRYTHDDEKVRLVVEDRSQATLHTDLPIANLGTGGEVPPKYKSKPIPMVYGHVDRSPCVIKSSPVIDEWGVGSGDIDIYPDIVPPTITDQYIYFGDKYLPIPTTIANIPTETGGIFAGAEFSLYASAANIIDTGITDFIRLTSSGGNPIMRNLVPIRESVTMSDLNIVPLREITHDFDSTFSANPEGTVTDIFNYTSVYDKPNREVLGTFVKDNSGDVGSWDGSSSLEAISGTSSDIFPDLTTSSYTDRAIPACLVETGIAVGDFKADIGIVSVDIPTYYGNVSERDGTHNIKLSLKSGSKTEFISEIDHTFHDLTAGWHQTTLGTVNTLVFQPEDGAALDRLVIAFWSFINTGGIICAIKFKINSLSMIRYGLVEDIINQDFYANVRGRGWVGGYDYNVAPYTIGHIVENELGISDAASDGYAAFTNSGYNENNWKYAFTVDKKINSKKLIEGIASASPFIPRFNNMGVFKFDVIPEKGGTADHTIKEADVIDFSFSRTKIEDVHTKIEFKYNWDYARGEFNDSVIAEVGQYGGILEGYDFDYYGFENDHSESTLVIDDDRGKYIRSSPNHTTAQEFAAWYLMWSCNQHLKMKVKLPLKYMNLEIGDLVDFDEILGEVKPYGINYKGTGGSSITDDVNTQSVYKNFLITSTNKTLEWVEVECVQMHNLFPCDQDCFGECGDAVVDDCGVCDGDNSPLTGTCDCEGTPNGNAPNIGCGCGVGIGDPIPDSDNICEEDCAGILGGSTEEDICGVCNGTGYLFLDAPCTTDEDGCYVCSLTGTTYGPGCDVVEGDLILSQVACNFACSQYACDCDGNVDAGCGCGVPVYEEPSCDFLFFTGDDGCWHCPITHESYGIGCDHQIAPESAEASCNSDCTFNCCPDNQPDCLGVCGGDAEFDDCNVCDGDGTSCYDLNIQYIDILNIGDQETPLLLTNLVDGWLTTAGVAYPQIFMIIREIPSDDQIQSANITINNVVYPAAVIGEHVANKQTILWNIQNDDYSNAQIFNAMEVFETDEDGNLVDGSTYEHSYLFNLTDQNNVPYTIDRKITYTLVDCPNMGDLNVDGGFNVLDIVTLANCVLANNCGELPSACAGDLNGDGGWNVLDVVTLANCVLANNCGE